MWQEDFLKEKLDQRSVQGTLRQLPTDNAQIDFLSNDYLGLARHPDLIKTIERKWSGVQEKMLGGTGSRLLSGNYGLYEELETLLAHVFSGQAALVFNSGYNANLALLSSVPSKGDIILYDEFSHVCLKEGAWLSKAESYAFRHNDLDDLNSKLDRLAVGKRCFVVTESLFSMDGDFAPLEEIITACEKFGALPIVDEAHSTGVYGKAGGGLLLEKSLQDRVFARVYTFGKAMGSHGACVVGSRWLIDYLVNFGRSFIYTTSLPPHTILSLIQIFKFLGQNPSIPLLLQQRITDFRAAFKEYLQSDAQSFSAIQPLLLGSNESLQKVTSTLVQSGFQVMGIRPPTVKPGTERIRICLHTFNTEKEIRTLLKTIASIDRV